MFGPVSVAQYDFLHGLGCDLFQEANSLKYLPLPANLSVLLGIRYCLVSTKVIISVYKDFSHDAVGSSRVFIT